MADINRESYAGQSDLEILGPRTIDGRGYDDALKLSNCTDSAVRALTIIGGREDCIDINRGNQIEIAGCELRPAGRYAMTIKGGASKIMIRRTIITAAGKSCDIELGNWSDQSQEPTIGVTLDRVRRADGKPLKVRVWHGTRPFIADCGPVDVEMVPRPIVSLFFGYKRARRWLVAQIPALAKVLPVLVALAAVSGCGVIPKPQQGGGATTTLGGATAPTVSTLAAPENPQSPTSTTIEKSTTREYFPAPTLSQGRSVTDRLAHNQEAGGLNPPPATNSPGLIAREIVTERATTQLGTAQKDTARELGTRLANMRGVMWVGIALLVLGPVVGWKLGWFTNGLIAGGVGLFMIILSTVLPGNEAWFGLIGLIGIPIVGFVYYRARADRDDASKPTPAPTAPQPLPAQPAG